MKSEKNKEESVKKVKLLYSNKDDKMGNFQLRFNFSRVFVICFV